MFDVHFSKKNPSGLFKKNDFCGEMDIESWFEYLLSACWRIQNWKVVTWDVKGRKYPWNLILVFWPLHSLPVFVLWKTWKCPPFFYHPCFQTSKVLKTLTLTWILISSRSSLTLASILVTRSSKFILMFIELNGFLSSQMLLSMSAQMILFYLTPPWDLQPSTILVSCHRTRILTC